MSTVALAVAFGIVATGAGAGIGVRFAQKTGWSATAVTGLVVLAGGLASLTYAVRVAWKALHRWVRLVLVPAGLLVLVVVFSVAQAVAYAVVPPTTLGSATPASYGMTYRDVSFRTRDGAPLSAWFVSSRNGAAIVLRHGSGSTRSATLAHAAVLARHGYGLLLVDARGHGRSGGRGMDLGWYGDRDVRASVDFLVRQPGIDANRIAVVGLSMGGEEAIGAAAADPRIHAVVAEGATARTAADKSRWLPHGVNGLLQRGIDQLTYALTDLLTPASPPGTLHAAVAHAAHTPFLLITAGSQPDEAHAAADLAAAGPGRVQVWNVPHAAHSHALTKDPVAWEARVVAFLDQHLPTAG